MRLRLAQMDHGRERTGNMIPDILNVASHRVSLQGQLPAPRRHREKACPGLCTSAETADAALID